MQSTASGSASWPAAVAVTGISSTSQQCPGLQRRPLSCLTQIASYSPGPQLYIGRCSLGCFWQISARILAAMTARVLVCEGRGDWMRWQSTTFKLSLLLSQVQNLALQLLQGVDVMLLLLRYAGYAAADPVQAPAGCCTLAIHEADAIKSEPLPGSQQSDAKGSALISCSRGSCLFGC